jgi:predicted GNAT superfamily acetyltransferase
VAAQADSALVDMGMVTIRDAAQDDFDSIVALNLAEVAHTSAMDAARLATLDRLSCYHRVACVDARVAGFLLAMRSGTPYENENFAWFSARHPDFVYVDRVVISAAARGLRLGSLLYEELFRWARINGVPLITCEYNIVPANEPSRRFHDKFGFREQGTQWVANRTKQVSLQVAET